MIFATEQKLANLGKSEICFIFAQRLQPRKIHFFRPVFITMSKVRVMVIKTLIWRQSENWFVI